MGPPIASIIAAVLTAGISYSASGASPEDAYIATRDTAIAKIKADEAAENQGPTGSTAQQRIDGRGQSGARRASRQHVLAIVGPVVIKGMPRDGKINLDTLNEGDEGFGMLDGMVYGGLDDKTRVIVTTDGMFKRWLRTWSDELGSETQLADIAKNNNFYTHAILTDSAVVRFAELPIRKSAGASFAYAMLAARTQSDIPQKADEIFVLVAQGDKVFLAYSRVIWRHRFDRRVRGDPEGLRAKGRSSREPNRVWSDDARQKKSDEMSGKSDSEFLRCFSEKASQQTGYAAAARGGAGAASTGCLRRWRLRRLLHRRAASAEATEDRRGARHREVARLRIVGGAGVGHHVGVLDAGEDVQLEIAHACRGLAEQTQARRAAPGCRRRPR